MYTFALLVNGAKLALFDDLEKARSRAYSYARLNGGHIQIVWESTGKVVSPQDDVNIPRR